MFKMDSKCNNTEKNSKLLIVPWYNKKEWLETYHQAYSDNVEQQANSYTQMCIWKARYPNLPLGVECTMNMLHVRLCDKQDESDESTTAFKDKDLQLLYSTAVMRFLNHLSVMSNCKDSMYKMAKQQKIPDWLINLRHEAAHGNSLPALYLLRQASDIIMLWLKTHYWETEADVMEDYFINRKLNREHKHLKIAKLLELWLILKMNYWSGRKFIDNITNEDVRKQGMELASEEGLGIKRSGNLLKKKDLKKMKIAEKASDVEEIENDVKTDPEEEYTHKIKTAFDPLLRKLFDPLKKKHKKTCYEECLIECLVNYTGFCPEINLEKLTEMETLELMSIQGDLWKELIEGLQTHSLLPQLICALLKKHEEHKVSSAHLWLRLLTQLFSGDGPHQPPGTQNLCQLLADSLPYEVDPQTLRRKANLNNVNPQRPLILKNATHKELDALQDLAHKVLANPTKCTSRYLESLLSFWETPLRTDTKSDLCALAKIYHGYKLPKVRPVNVYTIASLLDDGLVINQSEITLSEDNNEDISPWKLYSGDADWSKCALGTLPF